MTRAAVAALALVVAGALAACDDDPKPRIGPPESTSPAPTDPTSSAAVALNPKETVRSWVEAQNEALQTGDVTKARDLSDGCKTCENFLAPIEETYEAGGSYSTAGWRVINMNLRKRTGKKAEVAAAIKFAGGTRVPEKGASPVSFRPETHIMLFELARTDSWHVTLIGFVP